MSDLREKRVDLAGKLQTAWTWKRFSIATDFVEGLREVSP